MDFNYSEKEIIKRTNIALGILRKNDALLFELGLGERSIAHKLAEYLQDQFPDWNVDCEYNRQGIEQKKLEGIRECNKHRITNRVYPDIIVHERKQERNLLVIELKKSGLNSKCDIKKLELFTNTAGEFRYRLGVFIQFFGSSPKLKWFRDGKQI